MSEYREDVVIVACRRPICPWEHVADQGRKISRSGPKDGAFRRRHFFFINDILELKAVDKAQA
jgi:hypothetical protein